jgi:chloride channel 3/4/5
MMASSSAGNPFPIIDQGSSSSSQSPPRRVAIENDSDDDDPTVIATSARDILADGPLDIGEEEVVSFKRKQKQTAGSRFLSAITGNGSPSRQATPSPRSGTPTLNLARPHNLNTLEDNGVNNNGNTKDGGPLDWYVEGPGRRVGYENLTAIDWIFEYTKERQRLRMLYSSATGLLGYVQQFLDASQIWVLLILTGLSAGVFAAAIDVVSDWLGDLKTGYCSSGIDGGKFYLNRFFCCYGYEEWSQCSDWVPWSVALHVTSTAGKWFVEYIFFIIFSVSLTDKHFVKGILTFLVNFRILCEYLGIRICFVCKTQRNS